MKKLLFLLFFLACTHLAYAQTYTNKYRSVNFYKNGVTEYLEIKTLASSCNYLEAEIYYFTSKNPQKIRLRISRVVTDCVPFSECISSVHVTFPNENDTYILTLSIMALSCRNPNGQDQPFEYLRE